MQQTATTPAVATSAVSTACGTSSYRQHLCEKEAQGCVGTLTGYALCLLLQPAPLAKAAMARE